MASGLTVRRAAALLVLVAAVVAVHGCVVQRASQALGEIAGPSRLERLQATYVRTMEPAAPLPAARTAPAPRRTAAAPVPAAEPPDLPASEPEAPREPPPEAPPVAEEAASAPQGMPDVAPTEAPPFEWPLATRVTYDLVGHYQGPIHGDAQVEWLRDGDLYQVHLDVSVGPSLAPFMSRRMSSQGRITPDGLSPEWYEQETRLPFSAPTRAVVRLEPDRVRLANGQHRPRPPGVQDTASQFVQLAWKFSTNPAQLVPGAVVTVPLAMPRAVHAMVYDVSPPEVLRTSFGDVTVLRLVPRHVARRGGDLSVEMWIAPDFRYLPLRLKIHQDAETYVDMTIRRAPELGGAQPG